LTGLSQSNDDRNFDELKEVAGAVYKAWLVLRDPAQGKLVESEQEVGLLLSAVRRIKEKG